jgi:hypothetical protein
MPDDFRYVLASKLLWKSRDPDARPGEGVIDCKGLCRGGLQEKKPKRGQSAFPHGARALEGVEKLAE